LVNYIIEKDTNWLTINNPTVNTIANGFNARIQQSQRILFLSAEAVLLHDACEEYVSDQLMPGLNDKMDIYDEAIRLANQQVQDLLHAPRNNMDNIVGEVSNLLAVDFSVVDSVARDTIVLPQNTLRNHGQQIADLLQVKANLETAIQMLEQAIAFVENANAQQLRCRENTLRHVPIILGGEGAANFTERARRMRHNISAISKVVFPRTADRLSRFHVQIADDLEDAVVNADAENLRAQLESIRYNEGFMDFIEAVDNFIRVLQG
jgi:hypothetical protein